MAKKLHEADRRSRAIILAATEFSVFMRTKAGTIRLDAHGFAEALAKAETLERATRKPALIYALHGGADFPLSRELREEMTAALRA